MEKLYKILFIVVIIFTLFVVGCTFNKTVVKSDFIMIEDEEITEEVISGSDDQTENTIIIPFPEDIIF